MSKWKSHLNFAYYLKKYHTLGGQRDLLNRNHGRKIGMERNSDKKLRQQTKFWERPKNSRVLRKNTRSKFKFLIYVHFLSLQEGLKMVYKIRYNKKVINRKQSQGRGKENENSSTRQQWGHGRPSQEFLWRVGANTGLQWAWQENDTWNSEGKRKEKRG